MDFDLTKRYKPSTLYFLTKWYLIRDATKEYDMDKTFLHLMDSLEDLLPGHLEKLDDEALICECFCVSVKDIRDLCAGKVDLAILEDQLGLGNGCQSCLKRKDDWMNKIF